MKDMFFVITGVNARFDDGSVSILAAVSEDAAELAARKGKLASLVVTPELFAKGFCPGATGMLTGSLEEHGKRDDGSPWLRLRATKVSVTKRGNTPLTEDAVEFAE